MRRLLLTIVLLWCGTVLAEGETLYIIELQHRAADDVMPLLRPLLRKGEGLAGSGQQLLVSMSEPRRKEIERLITTIDIVPRQLNVAVRQTVNGVAVGAGNRSWQMGDGQRLFVQVGQSAAVVQRIVSMTGRSAAMQAEKVELKDLITGFDVVSRIHTKQVQLQITPRLMGGPSSLNDTFYFQELQIMVQGPIGQWIDVGTKMAQTSEVYRAILESAGAKVNERVALQVKVD